MVELRKRKRNKINDTNIIHSKSLDLSSNCHKISEPPSTNIWASTTVILLLAITLATIAYHVHFSNMNEIKVYHVFLYGWITAVTTGLGALPFFFVRKIDQFWLGVANAIACGMMVSASIGLIYEGIQVDSIPHMVTSSSNDSNDNNNNNVMVTAMSPLVRTLLGLGFGILFIIISKKILSKYEHLKFGELEGVNARKVVLIMAVMFLHSFSEGIGIGVSFGGTAGLRLGMFVTGTLALHNIPEGLAIALVLIPRGIQPSVASLWAIISSLPQPLMAVPAFIFIDQFLSMLPVGLGFAAGAMLWVAFTELLPEALEEVSLSNSIIISAVSCSLLLYAQSIL